MLEINDNIQSNIEKSFEKLVREGIDHFARVEDKPKMVGGMMTRESPHVNPY